MKVLVDTSVWSLALRALNKKEKHDSVVQSFSELIREARVEIIGPIRQELLSGIKSDAQFEKLKKYLKPFADLPLLTEDFEKAAAYFNLCRREGVQGSHTDFLICAVAERCHLLIFTLDLDFSLFAKHLPVRLYRSNAKG